MKKLTTIALRLLVATLAALTLTLIASAADAAAPTGFWKCSARGRAGLLLVILPNGRLSLEGKATRYRVSGNTLQVVYGGRWLRLPFRRSGSRLKVTMPTGAKLACRAVRGRTASLRGQMCSWSGASSSYAGASIARTHRVTFDGRGRFSSNRQSSYSGPLGGHYRRGGDKRGYYLVVGKKIIVVLASGASAMAYVHNSYRGRITEVKYNGKLYAAVNCK